MVKPPALFCPMLAKGSRRSLTPVIDVPSVNIVMKAWMSDPVASVAMNESTRSVTTTIPLITPITRAVPMARAMAPPAPMSVEMITLAVMTPVSDIV